MDFVEIFNICTRKVIIKAAKRIFNSDKICRSYCDFYFGVTFFGTQCISCCSNCKLKYFVFTVVFIAGKIFCSVVNDIIYDVCLLWPKTA